MSVTTGRLRAVEHEANTTDWRDGGSSQGYMVYVCSVCGDYWGCRHQYDPGTGSDDRWHRFGAVDPKSIARHY